MSEEAVLVPREYRFRGWGMCRDYKLDQLLSTKSLSVCTNREVRP